MEKNIKFKFFVLFLIITFSLKYVMIYGQEVMKTETETHIFWQPNYKITAKDFKGDGKKIKNAEKYCEKVGYCTCASVGVFSVLDIPKKKNKRGELKEKAYFVPAFERNTSFILNGDTSGIIKEKIIFDICEVSARFARQQLAKLQDTIKGYGIISMMFKSVEAKAIKMRETMVYSYTKDLFIDKKEGAYEKWRIQIDNFLDELKLYATKPEDCYRFITRKPLDKNYKIAKTVIDDLFKEKK